MLKVVAFNGSPRKDGNTTALINCLFSEIAPEGIETELVQLSERPLHGCLSCYRCFHQKDGYCAAKDDAANDYIEKMTKAQAIVLASPVYFGDMTPVMKALIDRAGFVSMANGGMYRNKVAATLAVCRRSGSTHTIDAMSHLLLSAEMVIAGRAIGIAKDKGDMEKDAEGIQRTKNLGKRIAWLVKRLCPES